MTKCWGCGRDEDHLSSEDFERVCHGMMCADCTTNGTYFEQLARKQDACPHPAVSYSKSWHNDIPDRRIQFCVACGKGDVSKYPRWMVSWFPVCRLNSWRSWRRWVFSTAESRYHRARWVNILGIQIYHESTKN